jgi:hypothetical protein
MRSAAGFNHDVDFELAHRNIGKKPLVTHLDDIAAGGADDIGHPSKLAGHIEYINPEVHYPSTAHQATGNDGRQHSGVDIAAAGDQANPFTLELCSPLTEAGKRCGAGSFNDGLIELKEVENRLFNFRL